MSYDPASLLPGDVVLVRTGDLAGRLIRWATVSPFSHAAIVGRRGQLVESLWRVTESGADKYRVDGFAFRVPGSTPAQRENAGAWAESYVGQRYGIREFLGDVERDVLHVPAGGRWLLRRYTCSGLVHAAWLQAGVRLTWAPLPSPGDLGWSPLLDGARPL